MCVCVCVCVCLCVAGGGLCDSLLIDLMRFSAVCVWALMNLNGMQAIQTDLPKYYQSLYLPTDAQ